MHEPKDDPVEFPPALEAELKRDLDAYEAELRKGIDAHLNSLKIRRSADKTRTRLVRAKDSG